MEGQSTPGTVTDNNVIANAISNQGQVPLADIAEAKFDQAEEQANEPTEPKESEQAEETPAEATPAEDAPEEPAEDSEATDESADDGYYADEGLEEVEQQDLQTTRGATEMGQWVLDNLPAIPVNLVIDGKPQTVQVKRAEDLPSSFEFASARDAEIFRQNLADQTQRAYKLVDQWQTEQTQAENTKFSQQEDRDIQSDIASLQREGLLDRFKYAPSDSKFDSDPAVTEMQNVLDFYNEQNQARWQESQRTGRLFNRLSYKDAFYLYRAQNPQTTPEQAKEDTSRKAATKTIAKAGKGTEQAQSRPRLPRNANIDQIINAYGL